MKCIFGLVVISRTHEQNEKNWKTRWKYGDVEGNKKKTFLCLRMENSLNYRRLCKCVCLCSMWLIWLSLYALHTVSCWFNVQIFYVVRRVRMVMMMIRVHFQYCNYTYRCCCCCFSNCMQANTKVTSESILEKKIEKKKKRACQNWWEENWRAGA